MTVLKRNNSKYWYIQFQIDSKTFVRSSKSTDKRIAEALEAKWKSEIIRSEYLGNKERILLENCLRNCLESKRNLASYSRMIDIEKMTRKYFIGNPYIDLLSNKEVFRFHHLMKQKGYQPATMRHLMNFFRQSIQLAKKLGYQTPNIEYPKISVKPTRLRYLTIDEENRLIASLNPYRSIRSQLPYDQRKPEFNYSQHQYHDFVIMLLDTGARFSEISTLEWSSIDLQSKTIRLWRPKVRNESILYMTDRVYEVLARRFDQRISNFIFTNSKGGAMKYISRMWERIFRRAGLDNVSAHTLRHTHASRLIQSGLSIYEVKEVLGHTDIHTTMRYSHLERVDAMKKAKDVMNSLNHRTNDHGTLATR